jgi:Stress responsive A/B Barrel Domain.
MPLRHVVTWKIAEVEPALKAEQIARIRSGLEALLPLVPGIRALEVGVNDVSSPGNWDLVLVADYDDADALRRYVEHPEHQKVAGYIRSVVSERSAVDFLVP